MKTPQTQIITALAGLLYLVPSLSSAQSYAGTGTSATPRPPDVAPAEVSNAIAQWTPPAASRLRRPRPSERARGNTPPEYRQGRYMVLTEATTREATAMRDALRDFGIVALGEDGPGPHYRFRRTGDLTWIMTAPGDAGSKYQAIAAIGGAGAGLILRKVNGQQVDVFIPVKGDSVSLRELPDGTWERLGRIVRMPR